MTTNTSESFRVLLIDDDDDLRRIACLSLVRLGGMSVREAENGLVGCQFALAEPPDIILCDVMMPVQDGPTTLQILRQHEATRDIPFIFLTAKARREESDTSLKGADGILTKPFNPRTLSDDVSRLARIARSRTGNQGQKSDDSNATDEVKGATQ